MREKKNRAKKGQTQNCEIQQQQKKKELFNWQLHCNYSDILHKFTSKRLWNSKS